MQLERYFARGDDEPAGISAITALARRFEREQQLQRRTADMVRTGECPNPDCDTDIEIEIPADYDPEYVYQTTCPECGEEFAWILDAADDSKVLFVEDDEDEDDDSITCVDDEDDEDEDDDQDDEE